LELPLAVVRAGALRVRHPGLTRNISSGGVLFTSDEQLDVGGPIEYIITLSNGSSPQVHLRCVGKVMRFERNIDNGEPSEAYCIAATLERYEFIRSEAARAAERVTVS
jgi:hypothetical protein